MMLSKADILTLSKKPAVSDMSLQMIITFYEEHLCHRTFFYEVEHESDEAPKEIRIRFNESNLPHLLGLHKIRRDVKYRGQAGYDAIKDGTHTFESLKKSNKSGFSQVKNRMLYFLFIKRLLETPTIIEFQANGTAIDVDLILYENFSNVPIYLHLGISKSEVSDYYYPKTFLEEKKPDRFITGRKEFSVRESRIEIDPF